MKLISIQLCNFRQFYGTTPTIWLASGDRNTTVFHGNNGAGKTSLTNGFTWVLYERFSAAFASEQQLVNKRAIAEAELKQPVECYVELEFEHHRTRYNVRRHCRAYRTESGVEYGDSQLRLQHAREDGRWMLPREPAEDIIAGILPESLHRYFFFDGERIEKLMRDERRSDLAEATKTLLGISVVDGAIRHLNEARKSLENELKGIGNPETKTFLREKQVQEANVERLSDRNATINRTLEQLGQRKHDLNRRLLELQGAEQLQATRNALESRREEQLDRLNTTRDRLRKAISTQGYTILLDDATEQFRAWVKTLRDRGEFPRGIQREFVEDLLRQQRCICGNELHPGSEPFENVRGWSDRAGTADVEEAAIRLSSQVEEIDRQADEFLQETEKQHRQIEQVQQELDGIDNDLDRVKTKLRKFPDEDVQQLQEQLDGVERQIDELNRELGANQQQQQVAHKEIKQLAKQVDRQQMNERRQLVAQQRIAAATEGIDRLKQMRDNCQEKFRCSLEERLQAIFRQISFTPYLPRLNENYELSLVETTAGREQVVPASTGENQILSLSFIGSIIDSVRDWNRRKALISPDTNNYPIVMDSPFGSLDEVYRRQVARSIPQLANQLVVLVTKTQWRGEVASEMGDRIGREYVLRYNSPKPDCEADSISRFGTDYPLVCSSPNAFEYTEVIPVEPEF